MAASSTETAKPFHVDPTNLTDSPFAVSDLKKKFANLRQKAKNVIYNDIKEMKQSPDWMETRNVDWLESYIFTDIKKQDIYYHYFTFEELYNALSNCYLCRKLNVIPEIMSIICNFVGITEKIWSNVDKSNNFEIIESKKKTISYAICCKMGNEWDTKPRIDTILFNEWIDIDNDKKIYHFIFKKMNKQYGPSSNMNDNITNIFNEIENSFSVKLSVGIVTCDFCKNFEIKDDLIGLTLKSNGNSNNNNSNNNYYYYYHQSKNNKEERDSIGWNVTQPNIATSFVCGKQLQSNEVDIEWNGFIEDPLNDENFDDFFMFEINLIDNTLGIICNAFQTSSKYLQCIIPKDIQNVIKRDKQMRLGVSLSLSGNGAFGIGALKCP